MFRRMRTTQHRSAVAAVIERGFTDGVAERLRSGSFTFADRAAVLAMGERLGMDRVRANRIVAEQQHRTPVVGLRTPLRANRVTGTVAAIMAGVAVQGGVVGAVAWAWMAR